MRHLLLLVFCACAFECIGQVDSLVNSGVLLSQASQLSDSGRYDNAIALLKKIDPRDTNFCAAAAKLAYAYNESKKPTEAIAVCLAGLAYRSSVRMLLLNSLSIAYAGADQYDSAFATVRRGMREFPFDARFTYRHGLFSADMKKFDEAEQFYFKTLLLRPYHQGAHLHLALLAMRRGEKVRAMFAMGVYLALSNSDNSRLQLLESFVKNNITDEYTIPTSHNLFSRMDSIIAAKVSFESDYVPVIPIDAGIVRQYQLLFDMLSEHPMSGDDSWSKVYLPVYTQFIRDKVQEPFIYHILTSSSIEAVPKWKAKNKKTLDPFYKAVNAPLAQLRKTKNLPELGYAAPVTCSYDNDGNLERVGNLDGQGKETGLWYYFHDNGTKSAEGYFKAGEKVGLWRYQNSSGIPTSTEIQETNEHNDMDDEGKPMIRYFLKDNAADGDITIFYPCGAIKQTVRYANAQLAGPGKEFYSNGTLKRSFQTANNVLNGMDTEWYRSGQKKTESDMLAGKRIGKYAAYFSNGRLQTSGQYQDGKATGEWLYYFDNGVLQAHSWFLNDQNTDTTKNFNRRGELESITVFGDNGNYRSTMSYNGGVVYCRSDYEGGILVKVTYFDKSGKVLSVDENKEGNFSTKGWYPTGEVEVEGHYLGGKRDGTWKFYRRMGGLSSQYEYKNGLLNGPATTFHENGLVKWKSFYKDDVFDGVYREFHPNGKVLFEGWFQEGKKQQKWKSYYANGVLSDDYFYLNDQIVGYDLTFNTEGKLSRKLFFNNAGKGTKSIMYDAYGRATGESPERGSRSVIQRTYSSGQPLYSTRFLCEEKDSATNYYLMDGKIFLHQEFTGGELNGRYTSADAEGIRDFEGQYESNQLTGLVTSYHDTGKPEIVGWYRDGKRDSLWTYFYFDGHKQRTISWAEGDLQGESEYFDLEGTRILNKMFDEDDLVSVQVAGKDGHLSEWRSVKENESLKCYGANGRLALEENLHRGLLDGVRRFYYPNGNLYSEYRYADGDYNGFCTLYYADGKPKAKKFYKDDKPDGVWEFFDPTGQIRRRERYVAGSLEGKVEIFENGRVIREQNFFFGLPTD